MKWRIGAKGGAGERLWKTGTHTDFTQALSNYDNVIQHMVRMDSSKPPKNTQAKYRWGEKPTCFKALAANDHWWHTEFGASMKQTGEATKEDLKRMLQWKWSRGKYRPGRTKFTDQVQEESVIAAVRETLKVLEPLSNNPAKADINAIIAEGIAMGTQLSQIGPASATGILAARYPEFCPMYADESMESIGMYREPYTAPRYIEYAEELRNKAMELGDEWTANKVCDALFSASKADQLGMLVEVKIKNEEEEEEEEEIRPKKRTKR
jgi:hypothetical protein